MSLVTLIRDYVDVANSSEQLDGYTFSSLVYYTFAFLFTVIKQAIIYCFTFHWFRDLSYFCFTSPSLANPIGQQPLSAFTNSLLEMNASISFESATKSSGIEYQPLANLLAFSDSGFSTNMGVVLLGFFNGCFSCMHFSAGNFLTIQRMLVKGIPAGLCSAFGTAVGQFSFLICILFGFRGLLFPWLVLEPLHFLLGAGILLSIASSTAQDRRTPTVQWSAKSSLLIYAFTSFALTWCEQTALFQWIGNISFGAEPTFLETTPSFATFPYEVQVGKHEILHTAFENIQQLVQNSSYLLAFFLGNIAGAFFIGYAVQRLFEWILRYKRIAIYYGLVKQANLPLATLIFAFGFGSLPYYGFDYLITKGFGFVPHERSFQQTLFSPVNLVSKTLQAKESSQGRLEDQLALLFTLEGERSKSFAVDTTPFDDGQYLKASQKRPQTFEDLNYRGEHLWTNRLSRISNMREQANQTQSSFLGPIFSWMRSFLWGDGTATNLTTTYPSNLSKVTNLYTTSTTENGNEDIASDLGRKSLQTPTIHTTSTTESGTGGIKTTRPEYSEEVMVNSIKERKKFSPFADPSGKHQEQIDNYVKEFDRQFDKGFSNFYNADPYSLIEVEDQWQEKRIKEKCYTNPIYTFLLNTEIDAFLRRQPNSHWLSPQEEVLLLKKRQLLSNYYDTLALTNQVSTNESLGQLLRIPKVADLHPKSYGNAIYNHQFKGTLKVARRLFSVKKVDSDSKKSMVDEKTVFITPGKDQKARVIKFDQPLYLKEKNTTQKNLFHEELNSDIEQYQQKSNSSSSPLLVSKPTSTPPVHSPASQALSDSLRTQGRSTEYPYPYPKGKSMRGASAGNEVGVSTGTRIKKSERKGESNIFLLEQAEPLPLYVSWDDQLRKLIVTNRFQNRGLAGYTFSEFPINKKTSTFFTTWPIPDPFFNKNQLNNKVASEIDEENNNNSIDSLPASPFTTESEGKNSQHTLRLAGAQHISTDPDSYRAELKYGRSTGHPTDSLSTQGRNTGMEAVLRTQEVALPTDDRKGIGSKPKKDRSNNLVKSASSLPPVRKESLKLLKNSVDSITRSFFHENPKNRFLFQTESLKEPITSDMVNALLQWQKLIKENKQLSKEDKQAAKEKISYWPENVNHSNWSNEFIDNDMDFDEPAENIVKKQTLLWEFTPPNHGGFLWPGSKITK